MSHEKRWFLMSGIVINIGYCDFSNTSLIWNISADQQYSRFSSFHVQLASQTIIKFKLEKCSILFIQDIIYTRKWHEAYPTHHAAHKFSIQAMPDSPNQIQK